MTAATVWVTCSATPPLAHTTDVVGAIVVDGACILPRLYHGVIMTQGLPSQCLRIIASHGVSHPLRSNHGLVTLGQKGQS